MNSEATLIRWDDREAPDWFHKIDVDEYQRLAGIGYTPEKIAMYYNIRCDEFISYFMRIDSPLRYYYERGQLLQQAKEGMNMANAAASGDNTTQAQRLDKLRKANDFRDNVNKVFFDDLKF